MQTYRISAGQTKKIRNLVQMLLTYPRHPAILLETPSLEHKADYKYPCDISISFYIGNKLEFRPISQITPKALRIKAKGMNKTHEAICCLIDKNGYAYGTPIHLNTERMRRFDTPSFLFHHADKGIQTLYESVMKGYAITSIIEIITKSLHVFTKGKYH